MTPRILPATAEAIAEAGQQLAAGGLVAFPTETVYGLGANALDADAVARVYAAKGRPAWNPLIVHVATVEEAQQLAAAWPEVAARLAATFWPGPLSLILPRAAHVPAAVSGGGDTIALRMPAHPVALALVRAAGLPIAAPSANRFMALSPTTAQHVADGLGGAVVLILDGGPSTVGIESTVVDLTGTTPRVLRPGMISRATLARALGAPVGGDEATHADGVPRPSPGMVARHYAPRATLRVVAREAIVGEVRAALDAGAQVGVLLRTALPLAGATVVALPEDPDGFARALYGALHDLDAAGSTQVLVEAVPDEPAWDGIRDRLRRAGTA